jgi:hypothetical protein
MGYTTKVVALSRERDSAGREFYLLRAAYRERVQVSSPTDEPSVSGHYGPERSSRFPIWRFIAMRPTLSLFRLAA